MKQDLNIKVTYIDVTDKWLKISKTTSNNIKMSDFTITRSGKRYHNGQILEDSSIVKFGTEQHEDIKIANWFKQKYMGKC